MSCRRRRRRRCQRRSGDDTRGRRRHPRSNWSPRGAPWYACGASTARGSSAWGVWRTAAGGDTTGPGASMCAGGTHSACGRAGSGHRRYDQSDSRRLTCHHGGDSTPGSGLRRAQCMPNGRPRASWRSSHDGAGSGGIVVTTRTGGTGNTAGASSAVGGAGDSSGSGSGSISGSGGCADSADCAGSAGCADSADGSVSGPSGRQAGTPANSR